MVFNDSTPIALRPADMADPIPAMTIELAAQMRALLDEAVQLRDLQRRALYSKDGRLGDRVLSRLVEHHESVGTVCDQFEALVRSLRAGGRL